MLKNYLKVFGQILFNSWRRTWALGPRATESLPWEAIFLQRRPCPWLPQAGPREYRSRERWKSGSREEAASVPQSGYPGGRAACSQQACNGRNPNHLVPLLQIQCLEEVQSKARSLPLQTPPWRSGWSSSSSGSSWGVRGAPSIQCQPRSLPGHPPRSL